MAALEGAAPLRARVLLDFSGLPRTPDRRGISYKIYYGKLISGLVEKLRWERGSASILVLLAGVVDPPSKQWNSMRKLAVFVGVLFLAACAQPPESIPASYVSTVPYENWSCQQLANETARLNTGYSSVAYKQRIARHHDKVGVLLLGLPLASLTGHTYEGEIADIKGQLAAVQKVYLSKGCR